MKLITSLSLILLMLSCENSRSTKLSFKPIRFEQINYYKYPRSENEIPFKYRLTYYFEDGKPHRWLELDSSKQVRTEYIYQYDLDGLHTGAKYREDGEEAYSVERVRYIDDRIKVTEWLDSIGTVYYTMTDYLNDKGNTLRAEFKGTEVHGFDSTFYTEEGFPRRIFFTNIKGNILNDRSFEYDSINPLDDWITRRKIVGDTLSEEQFRDVYYDSNFTSPDSIYYPYLVSAPNKSQNVFSFTANEQTLFLTETTGWDIQTVKLYTSQKGLLMESETPLSLDSIYNGAISPSGERLIYTRKIDGNETNWLIEKKGTTWSDPINLSADSDFVGGYFHWHTDTELFLYTEKGNGDLVEATLSNENLKLTNTLNKLNTENGTEFSPFVDAEKRFIIFTRYVDGEPSQQGFFISYNAGSYQNPNWEAPQKIENLPYGWNAYILQNKGQFLFTDGDNIKSVPVRFLNLK
ncbi:MAG: hypothetical protein HRT61_20810 [Ekhidna sp.]|nr:hypothetical protein [Ekhidna sp.]